MKAKKLITLLSLVCVLVVSTVCAVVGLATNDNYVFDTIAIQTEYYTGDSLNVPVVKVSDGENSFDTNFVLRFPDGSSYTDDDGNPETASQFKLNASGQYRLTYFTTIDGKYVSKKTEFTVKSKLYSTSGNKSTAVYGEATYKNPNNDDYVSRTGLKLALAAGEEFTYNKVIDISKSNKNFDLITFYALPSVDRELDGSGVTIVLTDAYDKSNTVEIKVKPVELPLNQMAESHWNWTYLSACAPSAGQVTTGYSKGSSIEVQVDTIYGTGTYFSFYGSNFYKTDNPINKSMTVSYNYAEKAVYVGTSMVVDLDDSFFFGKKLWGGFTTGEVMFGIRGNVYYKDTINLLITDICGDNLSGQNILDKNSEPEISVDFAGVAVEDLMTVIGLSFPVFKATAVDVYDGKLPVTVKAFNGYYSSSPTELDIVDGCLVADKLGVVTLEYSVIAHDGKVYTKLVDIPVNSQKTLSVLLEDEYTTTGKAGDVINIAQYTVSGNVGKANAIVSVTKDGKSYTVDNGTFTADSSGEYKIEITAVDFIGQKDFAIYRLNVAENVDPVFYGDVIIPEYMVVGQTYVLPDYTAYDFSLGKGTPVQTKISVNGVVGKTFKPTTVGDLSIDYIAETASGRTVKSYYAKAIDNTKLMVNGDKVLDVSKYFITDGVIVSADTKGVNIVAESGVSSAETTFINYLTTYEFNVDFTFNVQKKNFVNVEIILEDVLVKNTQIKICVDVYGKVSVNGVDTGIVINESSLYDETGKTSATVAFNARTGMITASGMIYQISGFVPFTDDVAKVSVKMNGINGDAEISIRKLCNQVLRSTTRKDNIEPILSYDGKYEIFMQKDDVLTIYRAVANDVLSPIKENTVTVYNPNGTIAKAIDGTELNKVPADRDYKVILSDYGTYKVEYCVIDDAGNNPPYSANIQITDNEPPVIKIRDTFPRTAKVGDVIKIPEYAVSDNIDKKLDVTVILYNDFDGLRRIWTDDYFVINEVANYSITYICYDSAGNVASLTVTIRVEG